AEIPLGSVSGWINGVLPVDRPNWNPVIVVGRNVFRRAQGVGQGQLERGYLLIVPRPGNYRVEVRARHLSAPDCGHEQNDVPLPKPHGTPPSATFLAGSGARRKSERCCQGVVQPADFLNNERSGGDPER